jgi:peptidoglycan/xylan/chitin deacetylase (PgdA/CDA1 family)
VRATTLLYHDVVDVGDFDASGFAGPVSARYKLEWPRFREHLDALDAGAGMPAVGVGELLRGRCAPGSWLLTFDDGGASAVAIGSELAGRGWRGHFFVTVDRIRTPGFLDEDGIRALIEQGHIVGSHSCSHPERMSHCSWPELLDEWSRSIEALERITGRDVVTASVPGGYSSPRVARAAAAAGVRALFTSDPTARVAVVDGCAVLGRYTILRDTASTTTAALRDGNHVARIRQLASWRARQAAKRLGGPAYLAVRRRILARR